MRSIADPGQISNSVNLPPPIAVAAMTTRSNTFDRKASGICSRSRFKDLEFGTPSGIRTRDLHLERVTSLAARLWAQAAETVLRINAQCQQNGRIESPNGTGLRRLVPRLACLFSDALRLGQSSMTLSHLI